jgi:hypothetical protein
MRRLPIGVGICAAALAVSGAASGGPQTTNVPAIFTAKVTLTDHAIAITPNHAARGSTVTFILTNRGKKPHTFVIGDALTGKGRLGFKQTLKPDQQFTKVMFLDYRGGMKFVLRTGTSVVARGTFRIR